MKSRAAMGKYSCDDVMGSHQNSGRLCLLCPLPYSRVLTLPPNAPLEYVLYCHKGQPCSLTINWTICS